MTQAASDQRLAGREAAIARRRAIADGGKARAAAASRVRAAETPPTQPAPTTTPVAPAPATAAPALPRSTRRAAPNAGRQRAMSRRERLTQGKSALRNTGVAAGASQGLTGRDAAIARRQQLIAGRGAAAPAPTPPTAQAAADECGCRHAEPATAPEAAPTPSTRSRSRVRAKAVKQDHGRLMSMARRAAMANRGKAGVEALNGRSGSSATATVMRSSGASSREIARKVREERCERGKVGESKPAAARPNGRVRRSADGGDASARVGVSETAAGQAVTGTRVGRSARTTGDESGSCRQVTGTEYLGAELFQAFCGTTPAPVPRPAPGTTPQGMRVTGNQIGRGSRVTGDEVGAARQLTGTPYTQPGSEGAPPKVGTTETYSGRGVTGTLVGRSERVTGDEPGTCKRVTGNEYVGAEQYQGFCSTVPEPFGGKKVGVDATWHGQQVTGSRTGRSSRVTGDEPGTCEIVTGTPYASPADYQAYCDPQQTKAAALRTPARRATPGPSLTGLQPGIGGTVSGDAKGACRALTGTPYVGQDQFYLSCGEGSDTTPGSADFPQPIAGGNWGAFSIQSPVRVAQASRAAGPVTGTHYAQEEGRITGPFNMGRGMVTGTENFRTREAATTPTVPAAMNPVPGLAAAPPVPAAPLAEEPRPRVTGEGMDAGARITGDDWGRNERVTGTEGYSAAGRNPTRRGGSVGPFAGARAYKESQARETPELQITGSSGNTERGALVTVSGGARG